MPSLRSVLIVDDSPDIRGLLRQALEMEGFVVHQAENGMIAQSKLAGGMQPCLVLLDLMMPVMDGRAFLNWKNQQPEYDSIPVIVISAKGGDLSLAGAKGFLRKPLDLNDLFQVVEGYCSG